VQSSPGSQVVPQPPQLDSSVSGSMQLEPQHSWLDEQSGPPPPQRQAPPEQLSLVSQT
jgi:hypothetical protein